MIQYSMIQFNTAAVAFTVFLQMQINCITCNSTLYTYLFFYYKMQVVFKDFWKRLDSARGAYLH